MGVVIKAVTPKSKADRAGIKAGDELLTVNGQVIEDVLDYMFYIAVPKVTLTLLRDGAE